MSKLTPFGKILIFLVIILIAGGVGWKFGAFDQFLPGKISVGGGGTNLAPISGDTIQLSLDEWIGWKPIIDANGGLQTKPGSIYDQLGLKVNIAIINDATQSSTALVKGSLNAAGYTVNRFAFLYPKFNDSNCPVKMVYITNASTGGDGIIAKNGINRIEDLVGKTIGVPKFSEAQTLIEWLLSKSSLSDAQVKSIRRNFKYFDTPDDAAKAFFGGQLDAAATWQPYLSQAASMGTAHVLFSTKSATNLILDGIVFRADYVAQHQDKVAKFIEGAIKADALYTKEFGAIRDSMPLFATENDDSIKGMCSDATLTDYANNAKLFDDKIVQQLYTDMCTVWQAIGEKSDPSAVATVFDATALKTLSDKFPGSTVTQPKFTEAQRQSAAAQSNGNALLTQRLSINFATGQAAIQPESFPKLAEFANVAKILNGVIIQIEGNTDNVGDPNTNKILSGQRAKAVATYLQYTAGLDPTRFVVVGNGQNNPIGDNSTDSGRAANRRTDVYFKVVQ